MVSNLMNSSPRGPKYFLSYAGVWNVLQLRYKNTLKNPGSQISFFTENQVNYTRSEEGFANLDDGSSTQPVQVEVKNKKKAE